MKYLPQLLLIGSSSTNDASPFLNGTRFHGSEADQMWRNQRLCVRALHCGLGNVEPKLRNFVRLQMLVPWWNTQIHGGFSKKGGTPVAGWLIMENPIDMDDLFFFGPFVCLGLGVTPIVGTHQINLCVKCKCVCVYTHGLPWL